MINGHPPHITRPRHRHTDLCPPRPRSETASVPRATPNGSLADTLGVLVRILSIFIACWDRASSNNAEPWPGGGLDDEMFMGLSFGLTEVIRKGFLDRVLSYNAESWSDGSLDS